MMGLIILRILCCQSEAVVNELLLVMESKSQQVWGFSSLHCFSNSHRIHRAGKWVVNRCSGKLDHLQSVYKHFLLAPCQFWHPPHFEKTCGYVPSPCPLGSFWWDWCWRQWRFCRNLCPPHHPIHEEKCHLYSLARGAEASTGTSECKIQTQFEGILN